MTNRTSANGMPAWVRMPGIVALVLVAVFAGAVLVGATPIGRSGMGGMGGVPVDQKGQPHEMGPGQRGPH